MITREIKVKDRCWTADYLTNEPLELEIIGISEDKGTLKCLELRSYIAEERGFYVTVLISKQNVYETREEALEECDRYINKQVKKLTEDLDTPEKLMEALIEAKVRINHRSRHYNLTTNNMERELKNLVKEYFDIEI